MKKNHTALNQVSTHMLRFALCVVGVIVLALCVFALPAMWRAVPGEYPDITYVFYVILTAFYVAAIPFFAALHQAFRLLNYIDTSRAFSKLSVRALRYIAMCGLVISGIFTLILPLIYVWAQEEDAPGLIVIGMILVGASLTVAVFAAVMQRLLGEAIAMKTENDLTV